jgi:3-hydroxyisobutyrate dehydrogenase
LEVAIDASTIDPVVAREVSQQATSTNAVLLDAPVSGGVVGAAAGTLTFMVGGPADTLQRVHPILSSMGQKIVHCGPSGSGQVVKARLHLPNLNPSLKINRIVDQLFN